MPCIAPADSNKFLLYNRKQYIKEWRARNKANEIIYLKKNNIITQDVYNKTWSTQSRKNTALKRSPSNGSTQ